MQGCDGINHGDNFANISLQPLVHQEAPGQVWDFGLRSNADTYLLLLLVLVLLWLLLEAGWG